MKVLVACEYSGKVREAFRKLGHDAWSCDLLPSDDNSPYHIEGDVLFILNKGWDLIIAHPPCTYLSSAGAAWFNEEKYGDRARQRKLDREEAAKFFMAMYNAPCDKVCVENPVGYMTRYFRKADQYIDPYWFGEPFYKKTGLWLKGLPLLEATNKVEPEFYHVSSGSNYRQNKISNIAAKRHWKDRSVTFQGIADAMAAQWGNL